MARLKLTLTVSVGFELIVVALLVVVRFAQSAYAQPLYPTITTLPLPSSEYDVYDIAGINHAGTVVGTIAGTSSGPAGWSATGASLSTQGLGAPGSYGSFGWGVNDNGLLAGTSGGKAMLATLGQSGQAQNLHDLLPGGPSFSEAWDVNNSGRACVTAIANTGISTPYLYDGSGMVALPLPVGSFMAHTWAINNSGVIVGSGNAGGFASGKAVVWSGGTATTLPLLPGRDLAFATNVNESGAVVGVAYSQMADLRGVIWQNGVPTDLGTLPLALEDYWAWGINASNQVVGFGEGPVTHGSRAFIWENGVMKLLQSLTPPNSGWTLKKARAINDRGWIAGYGISPSGFEVPFLLKNTPTNDTACTGLLVSASHFEGTPFGPEASADVALPCLAGMQSTAHGVWYRFVPPQPRLLRVHNSSPDPLVYGLFKATSCGQLTLIDCKTGNNSAQSTDNTAYFNLFGGLQYWLLVGMLNGGTPASAYELIFDQLAPTGACCTTGGCTMTQEFACTGIFRGPFQHCGDVPQYQSFQSAAIPDAELQTPGVLSDAISVLDGGAVMSGVKVVIDMNHERIGDLIITLTAPDGTSQDLIRRIDDVPGGCPPIGESGRQTALDGRYVFDDQSASPYGPSMALAARYFDAPGLVVPPGHYQATTCADVVVSLNSTFSGHGLPGLWTLTLTDNQSGATGTLNSWGLIIDGGNPPACACKAGDVLPDLLVNGRDIQAFVDCLMSGANPYCPCADMNADSMVDLDDLRVFVTKLLFSV